jgi:hypothetical protein
MSGNIHAFARRGDLTLLRQQVEEFAADINQPDVHKMTALHYSAKRGHLDVVKFLIERRADLELRNGTGQTPLLSAAQSGQTLVVDQLIMSKADPVRFLCTLYRVMSPAKGVHMMCGFAVLLSLEPCAGCGGRSWYSCPAQVLTKSEVPIYLMPNMLSTLMYVSTIVYTLSCEHTHTHTRTCTHKHTQTHKHTHTHTHTHTHAHVRGIQTS